MSRLSKNDYVGISWGDLHLSDEKPGCRAESKWFQVMKDHLAEVSDLQRFLNVPMFCNGDIFNQWDPSPELINMAMNSMPSNCCAIPGNHDLYFHSIWQLDKTGYGVLANATAIENVPPRYKEKALSIGMDLPPFVKNSRDCFLRIYGFPYDMHVHNQGYYNEDPSTFGMTVAMIHAYIWEKESHKHERAADSASFAAWKKKIDEYDFVLFGDNHTGFISGISKNKNVCNTGTFMRRTVSEIDYRPFVGLLRKDGNIEKYTLQTPNHDCFHRTSKARKLERAHKMRDLMATLTLLEQHSTDFPETVKVAVKKYSKRVKKVIMKILDKVTIPCK